MSDQNGQRGLLLGGRQMTITLDRRLHEQLTILSKYGGVSQHDMLKFICEHGIMQGWNEMLAERLFFVLTRWLTWTTGVK